MALIDDDLRQPLSDAAIVDRVVAAVMEQKLAAGAKLPEAPLCEAFDCNRSQIRRVLIVLADRGVVTLHPNRGAFVASPDAEEARNVFEARRAIERSIVLAAASRIDAATLEELRRERAGRRRRGGARRPQRVDPPVRPFPSPPRRGGGERRADPVPRGSRRANLPDHRPLRLPGDALLLGGGARRPSRRARRARRAPRRRPDGPAPCPSRASARHSRRRRGPRRHPQRVREIRIGARGSPSARPSRSVFISKPEGISAGRRAAMRAGPRHCVARPFGAQKAAMRAGRLACVARGS